MQHEVEAEQASGQGRIGRIAAWVLAAIVAGTALVLLSPSAASAAPTAPTACSTADLLFDRTAVDRLRGHAGFNLLRHRILLR